MGIERVRFPARDGQMLAGILHLPETARVIPGAALLAHCFSCGKDLHAAVRIARHFAKHGLAALRFDFTGLGESEGEFANGGIGRNLEDLLSAAHYLDSRSMTASLLVGHSLGGAACLMAASEIPACKAVVTLGAPADTQHLARALEAAAATKASGKRFDVRIGGRNFQVDKAMLKDLQEHRHGQAILRLGLPLLILHSPTDEVVDIEHARRIYKQALHPKSFVALDGADHLLSDPMLATWTADLVLAWARRYLEIQPENT